MKFALLTTALLCSLGAAPDRNALIAMGKKPDPPVMFKRPIAPPATKPAGEQIDIIDGDCKTVLFIPAGYVTPADGKVDLAMHFHAAVWFAIDEHLRRSLNGPLLAAYLGEGSVIYGKPFKDPERLARLLALVEAELSKRGAAAHVDRLGISSFSAGYGAVREIIQVDKYLAMIHRIVLCDSLYAGWDPATTAPGATSRPALENMQPFEKYVRMAANGEKTLVLVHSFVPTPYANTAATAKWVAELVDAPRTEIAPGSSPASSDKDFPLQYRADLGYLHLWGYGGEDAQAHMTHARHLADVWKALDACGEP
jgi:hypothetical protein